MCYCMLQQHFLMNNICHIILIQVMEFNHQIIALLTRTQEFVCFETGFVVKNYGIT